MDIDNKNNIKVAVIEPVGGHGGMDYYDFGLCGGLADAGVNVALYTCDETQIPDKLGFSIHTPYKDIYGNDSVFFRFLRYLLGTVFSLISCVYERRGIVHFHWFHVGPLEVFNIVLAKILFRKIIVTAHDVEAFAEGLSVSVFVGFAYKLADRIIAHNEISRLELVDKISIPEEKIEVIPHGNYLDLVSSDVDSTISRKNLNIPEHAKVLLFFGQIKDVKGLDILLEALVSIKKSHPSVVLLIAGKVWKTDFSKYDKLIDQYQVRDQCILNIRFIPDSEISNYYSSADLVVLPYKRIYQSGVLLMAMSFGKAVVVSDLPGMLEVVEDKKTGFVFESGNSVDLASIISNALNDARLLNNVASGGKLLMKQRYDWRVIGQSVSYLYSQVLGR